MPSASHLLISRARSSSDDESYELPANLTNAATSRNLYP
jgi:hypothetical protein